MISLSVGFRGVTANMPMRSQYGSPTTLFSVTCLYDNVPYISIKPSREVIILSSGVF